MHRTDGVVFRCNGWVTIVFHARLVQTQFRDAKRYRLAHRCLTCLYQNIEAS